MLEFVILKRKKNMVLLQIYIFFLIILYSEIWIDDK